MAGDYASIIRSKAKAWNCEDMMDSVDKVLGKKIPFSSPMMNYATYGGIPRAKITEFYGEPGGGKSSTAVDICKNAVELFEHEHEEELEKLSLKCKENKSYIVKLDDLKERGPKKVLYIDVEHGFDVNWSKTLGIDRSTIEIMQPPDIPAEELLNAVEELICSGEVGLIILDSVPSLVTKAELEKKLGDRTVSALAGLMTIFLRKTVPLLTRYDTTMVLINQTRDNMDNPYVVNTPGGRAIKFYSSLRIYFRLDVPIDFLGQELPQKAEDPAGHKIAAKITKQKTAPFDRKLGTYYLLAKSGVRPDFDYANLAIQKYGIIRKSGAWFTVYDPNTNEVLEKDNKPLKLNGLSKVFDFLQTNQVYYNSLKMFIDLDINKEDESCSQEIGELI